ncbi:hypothetical protein KAX02_11470 [candidate division WOR-3 bacterium]|nr:hypothetical protein [candidate division WOR-3 bacterium]
MTILLLYFVTILTSSSNFADSLFEIGDYRNALIEYERLDFFSPSNEWKYKKGICYRELVKTYVLLGDYSLAKYECRRSGDKELMAWVMLHEGKWDESFSLFNKLGRLDISSDIQTARLLPQKEIKKAQMLSYIVPGLGEIYAGKPLPGFCTLSLNLLFGWLSIKSFMDDRPLDGVLVTVFLWSRFYHGGIENAGRAAHKFNEEKKSAFIREIQKKYGFELENGDCRNYR